MIYTARQGHRYQARIQVGWLKRSFASESAIADKLREAGFTDVIVKKGSGAGEYYAWAAWTWPDSSAELPDEIQAVEDISK